MGKTENKAEKKKKIRSVYLKRRNKLEPEKRKAASEKIRKRLYASKRFKAAQTIFVYASYKSEVQTKELIQDALKMGKRVAVPKVVGEEMHFYEILSWEELFPGYQGILEPQISGRESLIPTDSDLIVLPGAVFDRRGGRIGYGGGYYDRYWDRIHGTGGNKPYLLALAYHCQMYPGKIPLEEHDIKMDCILTERGAILPDKLKERKLDWIGGIFEIVLEFILEIVVELFD